VTYRIHRAAAPDAVVFVLSGEMDTEHTTRLAELLATEVGDLVILDLKDVTLVDRDAVRFLADAEGAGVRIVNCPDYVRSWIAAEREWHETRAEEPEAPEPHS
jgi:anti-anti-sigma regulatory factor